MAKSTKSILVPEARNAMNNFKMECAKEIGMEQYTKENNDHYRGDVSSYQNGKEGGPIGGQMTKKMIEMAKKNMK